MAPKPETIRNRMRKRVFTARKTHVALEAHFDPESAAAVIVARNRGGTLVALFFAPQVTTWFDEVPIVEQDIPNLGRILKERRAEALARKLAPHDIPVGAVFVYNFGATIRRITFYRVVSVPSPRKIGCVEIPAKAVWGTIEQGSLVPDFDREMTTTDPQAVFEITMESGSPSLKVSDWGLARGYLWSGSPETSMTD
ncbi:hypothetical protein ILP92_17900 [Maribius pontilimi]|uniref:Uncharacterized protein n=1 Tax=Palleronia pontilimi TaxID=1964209 RepID=A0A934MEJ9_9RHOB|nr:hypothetical protein [Palleronia pontilimi]MBJ3764610.1 hypothetical protein [Palleronia pontilimi]